MDFCWANPQSKEQYWFNSILQLIANEKNTPTAMNEFPSPEGHFHTFGPAPRCPGRAGAWVGDANKKNPTDWKWPRDLAKTHKNPRLWWDWWWRWCSYGSPCLPGRAGIGISPTPLCPGSMWSMINSWSVCHCISIWRDGHQAIHMHIKSIIHNQIWYPASGFRWVGWLGDQNPARIYFRLHSAALAVRVQLFARRLSHWLRSKGSFVRGMGR